MASDQICPACSGSGWLEVRTRGMCGCDTDFDERERTPCEVCGGATRASDAEGFGLACEVAS